MAFLIWATVTSLMQEGVRNTFAFGWKPVAQSLKGDRLLVTQFSTTKSLLSRLGRCGKEGTKD
jgi:hypothetical protein